MTERFIIETPRWTPISEITGDYEVLLRGLCKVAPGTYLLCRNSGEHAADPLVAAIMWATGDAAARLAYGDDGLSREEVSLEWARPAPAEPLEYQSVLESVAANGGEALITASYTMQGRFQATEVSAPPLRYYWFQLNPRATDRAIAVQFGLPEH